MQQRQSRANWQTAIGLLALSQQHQGHLLHLLAYRSALYRLWLLLRLLHRQQLTALRLLLSVGVL
jgi:hypothetical protein